MDATTHNNMQQGVQMDIQQCWEMLANNIVSVNLLGALYVLLYPP